MSTQKLKIHLIGIGGIGVSALAQYYLAKGHQVSGSDLVSSETTSALKKKGAKISIGQHRAGNIPKDVDLVIYSPAVKKDNPELKAVLNRSSISTKSYPEALGELTKQHFTIAVSGTHGKSTTTVMIGLILVKAGFDPTVIVGTKVKQFNNSNCQVGGSEYLIIEADEHFASFLNYWPKIIVLTNIEKDHLDYYKNLNNILKAYKKYVNHLSRDGILIANQGDQNVRNLVPNSVFYSLKQKEAKKLRKLMKVPGEHNVSNALAALTVARILKISDKVSFKVLSEYRGSWRRFEVSHRTWNKKKVTVVSDYGHHPTEIRATLRAAREKWPQKEIWCIFQPHQYQRTHYLFKDFLRTFAQAPVDRLIITDIYDVAGRENMRIKKKVSSQKLIKAISKDWANFLSKKKIANYLKRRLQGGEVVIIMGAGDIYEVDRALK